MADRSIRKEFDREFFDRYYARKSSAVVTEDDIERLARFVFAYLDYLGVKVESLLDAGCGVGLLKRAAARVRPSLRYTGIDPSAVEVADVRLEIEDHFAVGLHDHAEHAVGRRVLRPHVDLEQLALDPGHMVLVGPTGGDVLVRGHAQPSAGVSSPAGASSAEAVANGLSA